MTDAGTQEYHEAPRSYASLGYFVALMIAGFVVDMLLGGGTSHVIGWSIAFVLVVGMNFIIVYAVRSQKTLHVTAESVSVGEETIVRPGIVAVADPEDLSQLPVLGWPTGIPRNLQALPVRLADGLELLLPTRHPDRLRAALGLPEERTAPTRPEVRAASRRDLPLLPELDSRAEVVFRAAGYDLPSRPVAEEALAAAPAVFVAGDPPVGFVWVEEIDGLAHVREVAVLPRRMAQGIGTELLERACEWAAQRGYPAITLTAYAEVSWNAPYFARHGFTVVGELTPGLVTLREAEQAAGLDGIGRRVVMRRELD